MSDSAEGLIRVLEMVRTSAAPSEELTERVRLALVKFGSETEDNLSCAQGVEVGLVGHYRGVKLVGRDELLSNVIAALEESPIPDAVLDECPGISVAAWRAVIRASLLVLAAFEKHEPPPADPLRTE